MDEENRTTEQLTEALELLRREVAELKAELKLKEIEKNQWLTAEREQRALAEALCQTSAVLTSAITYDEALNRILEQISCVVPHDAACIILVEDGLAHVSRWRGYTQNEIANFGKAVTFNLNELPTLQRVMDTHEPAAVSNVKDNDELIGKFGKDRIKSYAIAPIYSRGRPVGFINVDSETHDFFEETDAKYLKAFADQAAIALENIWVYDQARHEILKRVEALKKERNFNLAVLDTIGAIVIVLDTKGRIAQFNRACAETVGYTLEEIKGRYFWELFLAPQDRAPAKAMFHNLQSGQIPGEQISAWRTRHGKQRLIAFKNTALRNEQGNIEYIISAGLDITEQQQTEEALRENKKAHRSFTDQLPIGVYRITPEGKLLHANPALATLLGYKSVEELLRTPILTIYGDAYLCRKLVEQGEANGGIINDELKCRTKDGREIWIRNTGHVIRNKHGEIQYISGTVANITERKLAEKALQDSEERFRHVMSSISDHIYVTETTGSGIPKNLYLSPHVEQLTGYPWQEFKDNWQLWLAKVIHPDDRVTAGAQMARAMMGRDGEVEYRLVRADGKIVWVRDSVRVETKSDSKIIYGVVSDITARKRAEEALAAERERLVVTLRSINDGVVAIDDQDRIILANPIARTYLAKLAKADFGDILTHLAGRPLKEIFDGQHYQEVIAGESSESIFEIEAHPMDTAHKTAGWVLIIRDITEKRAIQEKAQQQERLAAVGQLAAGIAHDFNNILTSIIGISELASDKPDIPQKVRQDMRRVAEQGRRAAHLTRQILDFGRRSITEKQLLNLDIFLKDTIKLLKRTISENIHITLEMEPGEFKINADSTQIQQVLTNLAINAQDAMPAGGSLQFNLSRLALSADKNSPYPELTPGDWLVLSVADNGQGIAPEHLSHIFEPFFTTKEIGKGTGLGLAQVYGLVKQHDGYIDVESQVEVGTRFTLYLPALPLQNIANQLQTAVEIPNGQGEVILLVEDDPTVLAVTQSMLERLGYQVLSAANGRWALDMYYHYRDKISLVLTDVTMPEIDGLTLCQELRAKNKAVKVVAMTGYPLKEETDNLRAYGFVGWLSKPLNVEKVAQEMNRALSVKSIPYAR
jgi:PAS domain S-box-containing protein